MDFLIDWVVTGRLVRSCVSPLIMSSAFGGTISFGDLEDLLRSST